MSSKNKGFNKRQGKAPTKGQLVQQQGSVIESLRTELATIKQFVFQNFQQYGTHLNNMQREVTALSQLVRCMPSLDPLAMGDQAVIDCLGREVDKDGKLSEDYNQSITFGGFALPLDEANSFFPDLIKELVGKKRGDMFSVITEVPDSYPVEALHGKTVQLKGLVVNVFKHDANNMVIINERVGLDKARTEKQAAELKKKVEAQAKAKEEAEKEGKVTDLKEAK